MNLENITAGIPLKEAKKALIMIHGRGASSSDILSLSRHLNVTNFALIAPQAENHTWYPYSFLAPIPQNEPSLSKSLKTISDIVESIKQNRIENQHIYFLGFSQGACLALEFVTRNASKYGGVVAFTGGLIGDFLSKENYTGNFENTPVFIGTSDPDMHVPVERVNETEIIMTKMGASVTKKIYADMGHTISQDEIDLANQLIFNTK
ncbi:MAG: phospholipase [Flavobacterium sp.]|nr:MAG: phospholipase [Flavobacterium sp.]